jgi:hypothetical protein
MSEPPTTPKDAAAAAATAIAAAVRVSANKARAARARRQGAGAVPLADTKASHRPATSIATVIGFIVLLLGMLAVMLRFG